MNIKKVFTICLFIVSFALFISAQDRNKERDLAERQRLEELQRLQDERERNSEKHSVADINGLAYFLPKKEDSWYISVTENGGFTGVSKLIAAINSDGNYLCSREQNFENQFLVKSSFAPLFQRVENFNFKKSDFKKPKEIKYCKDCSYKTLTFQNANKFYVYNRVIFTKDDGVIKEIYDEIINLTACR